MQVILLEKVKKLGDLGDTVNVKPGYGRNFLLPQGKALPATEANRQVFEARKADLVKKFSDSLNAAKMRAEKIGGKTITIKMLAAEEGRSRHADRIDPPDRQPPGDDPPAHRGRGQHHGHDRGRKSGLRFRQAHAVSLPCCHTRRVMVKILTRA